MNPSNPSPDDAVPEPLDSMQPGLERVPRIGPFVCEWCGVPLASLQGTRREGNVIKATGTCREHGKVWARDVPVVEGH